MKKYLLGLAAAFVAAFITNLISLLVFGKAWIMISAFLSYFVGKAAFVAVKSKQIVPEDRPLDSDI